MKIPYMLILFLIFSCNDKSITMKNKDVSIRVFPLQNDLNTFAMHNLPDSIINLLMHSNYGYYFKVQVTNISDKYIYISHVNKMIEKNTNYINSKGKENPADMYVGNFRKQISRRYVILENVDIISPKCSEEYIVLVWWLAHDIKTINISFPYIIEHNKNLDYAKSLRGDMRYGYKNSGRFEIVQEKYESDIFYPVAQK